MHIVGLVGGIACGKSQVAKQFAMLGAEVLDADQAAHKLLILPHIKKQLVARWGNQIIQENGEINRKLVAKVVFGNSPESVEDLKFLEGILHPEIRSQFEQILQECARNGTSVVVIDAPLLLEADWGDLCDSVVFVECPEEIRWGRAKLRNWTPEEFAKREAAQMSIEQKKDSSTHLVENSGSFEALREQIQSLWIKFQQTEKKVPKN